MVKASDVSSTLWNISPLGGPETGKQTILNITSQFEIFSSHFIRPQNTFSMPQLHLMNILCTKETWKF
jgi:hypothetical protein